MARDRRKRTHSRSPKRRTSRTRRHRDAEKDKKRRHDEDESRERTKKIENEAKNRAERYKRRDQDRGFNKNDLIQAIEDSKKQEYHPKHQLTDEPEPKKSKRRKVSFYFYIILVGLDILWLVTISLGRYSFCMFKNLLYLALSGTTELFQRKRFTKFQRKSFNLFLDDRSLAGSFLSFPQPVLSFFCDRPHRSRNDNHVDIRYKVSMI